MKLLIVLLSVLFILSCGGQNKVREDNQSENTNNTFEDSTKTHDISTLISKDFEVFDFETFDSKKDQESDEYIQSAESEDFLRITKAKSGLYYYEVPRNSLYAISKVYYTNGNIKTKGVGYVNWFETGMWYYFDENGKLIEAVDHDKPFKFTFDKILDFCQKEKIPVAKGAEFAQHGYHTHISREATPDSCWWTIRWLSKPTIEETITINGITGEVKCREYKEYL